MAGTPKNDYMANFDYSVRGMLVAQGVLSLDDAAIERACEGICGAGVLPSAKRQRDEGLTIEALYKEFGKHADWWPRRDAEATYVITVAGGFGPDAWKQERPVKAPSLQQAIEQVEKTLECDAEIVWIA